MVVVESALELPVVVFVERYIEVLFVVVDVVVVFVVNNLVNFKRYWKKPIIFELEFDEFVKQLLVMSFT